ncbi:tetratricopeptide repeat protein [Silvibacterium dinghuense]|uniref:Tetratricopeptide repeat protein n=1 Tax=Silvibacterium dinghuense TaxID=1560006 RepID=A0A4Q1SG79_9BACT|nr:tetratricopeptide repeat protein [Silvibacterium dinghuense]RXS96524.1 tetratricopeptide repeat protein [Silvibacterium dinghuense]GGG91524.1 hypothetical protein GCM10011586_02630 [Silvibacterium dinghuense]
MLPVPDNARSWIRPAVQIAAAGLGASAGKFVEKYAEKYGESAAEKILDLGEDSVLDKLKDPALHLDDLYRQTLRVSLQQLAGQRKDDEDRSWFQNWETSLAAPQPLALDAVPSGQYRQLDDVFCRTMIRIDAEGAAIGAGGKASITLTLRELPVSLRAALLESMPALLDQNFRALIITPAYEQAWKSSQLIFQEGVQDKLEQIGNDAAATRQLLESFLQQQSGASEEKKRLEAELASLRAQLLDADKSQQTATLVSLLSIHDFAGALHLKNDKITQDRSKLQQGSVKPEELAHDLFELGMIHELQRDWLKARDAYGEAWQLDPSCGHGFKYAYASQTLHDDRTAIEIYEKIADMPASSPERAPLFTNLGILYARQGRSAAAEKAYLKAIDLYRALASQQPDAYLAALSGTYGDLAQLYGSTGESAQKIDEIYRLALDPLLEAGKAAPLLWLPQIAEIYTGIGFYKARIGDDSGAAWSYRKALGAYNEIRSRGGTADIGKLAVTLAQFATLETRLDPAAAGEDYESAIAVLRVLTDKANAAIYGPLLIEALYSRAQWLAVNGQTREAVADYREALSLYPHDLAAIATPDARHLAEALDALGALLAAQKDWPNAEKIFDRAVTVRTDLALRASQAPDAAAVTSLLNRAKMRAAAGRFSDAWTDCVEAGRQIEPLWRADPLACGDLRALICILQAGVGSRLPDQRKDQLCMLAQDALACAREAATRAKAQTIVNQLCGPNASPAPNS